MLNRAVTVALALAIVACGGGAESGGTTEDGTEATEATDQPTTSTTSVTAPTTTGAPATTTTTQQTSIYESLSEAEQMVVDNVCASANDGGLIGETTFFEVLTGYSGVPELEEAFLEVAEVEDGMTMIPTHEVKEAAAQGAIGVCAEIGWTASEKPPSTTAPAASAMVVVEIGDLQLSGEVEGCPPAEIESGEYWVGPNGDVSWTDSNGIDWTIDLSVDATSGDLLWSFSFTGDSHRLISYHENQSTFQADITADMAHFETIFSDSLAEVSGGWPDTAGTMTITCS